jgi:putative transposase
MIRCERSWTSARVISALADVMVMKGIPEHLRSDHGPEFVARNLRKWLKATGAKTLYIEPGSPWENGYCESFNSKLRDEFLNGEIFYSIKEIRVLVERWRVHYNTVRPHSSLGYRPPAPAAWLTQTNAEPETKAGYGKTESKNRFPLFHTPDCGVIKSKNAALHSQFHWYKTSGRPVRRVKPAQPPLPEF